MSFVHLHVHTCYSFQTSTVRPNLLANLAASLGHKAVACTDRTMHGVYAFWKACRGAGIKPIIGLETYDYILLAKNLEGYRALCRKNFESPHLFRLSGHIHSGLGKAICMGGDGWSSYLV